MRGWPGGFTWIPGEPREGRRTAVPAGDAGLCVGRTPRSGPLAPALRRE